MFGPIIHAASRNRPSNTLSWINAAYSGTVMGAAVVSGLCFALVSYSFLKVANGGPPGSERSPSRHDPGTDTAVPVRIIQPMAVADMQRATPATTIARTLARRRTLRRNAGYRYEIGVEPANANHRTVLAIRLLADMGDRAQNATARPTTLGATPHWKCALLLQMQLYAPVELEGIFLRQPVAVGDRVRLLPPFRHQRQLTSVP
jgi:hypothetical protein